MAYCIYSPASLLSEKRDIAYSNALDGCSVVSPFAYTEHVPERISSCLGIQYSAEDVPLVKSEARLVP